MSFPISQAVLDAVYLKFTENNEGFNETFNALAPSYSITERMNIQFTTSTGASPNFTFGNIDPEDWVHTSATRYPFMTMFTSKSKNMNWQKFHQFSGDVNLGVNVFIDWKQGRVKYNFESYANCVEETLYTVFNRARNAHVIDQDWGDNLVYNGDFEITKSRIERAAESWRQGIFGLAGFTVDEKGEV